LVQCHIHERWNPAPDHSAYKYGLLEQTPRIPGPATPAAPAAKKGNDPPPEFGQPVGRCNRCKSPSVGPSLASGHSAVPPPAKSGQSVPYAAGDRHGFVKNAGGTHGHFYKTAPASAGPKG